MVADLLNIEEKRRLNQLLEAGTIELQRKSMLIFEFHLQILWSPICRDVRILSPNPNPALIFYVFTYLIQNRAAESLYYGYTADLPRKFEEISAGYRSENDARNMERKLKDYGQSRTHLKRHLFKSLLKYVLGFFYPQNVIRNLSMAPKKFKGM